MQMRLGHEGIGKSVREIMESIVKCMRKDIEILHILVRTSRAERK